MKPRQSSWVAEVADGSRRFDCWLFASATILATAILAAMSAARAQEPDSRHPGASRKTGEESRPSSGTRAAAEARPAEGQQAELKPAAEPKSPASPTAEKKSETKTSDRKGTDTKKTDAKKTDSKKTDAKSGASGKVARRGPPTLEARLVEGGALHLALLDERLEFITPYGRLSVPLADVRRVEFATRASQEIAERTEKAIHDLAADEFDLRERASAELLELKERAYAALLKAAEHSDPEVARRADDLLRKLRDSVPEERLTQRESDVIYTKDSKFTGKLVGDSLKVLTAQFGEQRLKFADVVSLGHAVADGDPVAVKNVQADPGTLHSFQAMIGQTFTFRVTGATGSTIWGTDMYTLDSALAAAAVHAGVVKVGETGNVRVQILGAQGAFLGSTRHGVTSSEYGGYPGAYRILSSRK